MTKSWPFCFAILQPPCELSSAQWPPHPSCWSSGLWGSRSGWWGPVALMEMMHDQGELEKTSLLCISFNPNGQGWEKVVSKLRQNFLPLWCFGTWWTSQLYVYICVFTYMFAYIYTHIWTKTNCFEFTYINISFLFHFPIFCSTQTPGSST